MELAERFGRTKAELLYGSPSHRPMSSAELTDWIALDKLRNYEANKSRR